MKASSLYAPHTRIVPASKSRKAKEVTKNADGSLSVLWGSGETTTIPASEPDIQLFVIFTMLDKEATA
jgi:hypothetical protein